MITKGIHVTRGLLPFGGADFAEFGRKCYATKFLIQKNKCRHLGQTVCQTQRALLLQEENQKR